MTTLTLLSHPLILSLTQRLTTALLAAFTNPTSPLRALLLPVFIAWNIALLGSYVTHLPHTVYIIFLGIDNIGGTVSYFEKLLFRRWSFATYPFHSTPSPPPSKSYNARSPQHISSASRTGDLWQRIRFGAYIAFSNRYISTPHQAANTPPYSTSNPNYIASRLRFLARKSVIVAGSYFVSDMVGQAYVTQASSNASNNADHTIALLPLLHHCLTTTTTTTTTTNTNASCLNLVALRIASSIGFWIGAYFSLQLYLGIGHFLAIATGVSTPEFERPLFGSVGALCTVRGFLGRFWQQLLRWRLSALADWGTYGVLGLPRSGRREGRGGGGGGGNGAGNGVRWGRLVARYTHLLCCFLVSGLMHYGADIVQGMKWWESGAVQCFVLMCVGIVVEDGVQWVWFDVLGGRWGWGEGGGEKSNESEKERTRRRGSWWTKAIGYLWVVIWLSVASPYYVYPIWSRMQGTSRDSTVPFSVVGYLMR